MGCGRGVKVRPRHAFRNSRRSAGDTGRSLRDGIELVARKRGTAPVWNPDGGSVVSKRGAWPPGRPSRAPEPHVGRQIRSSMQIVRRTVGHGCAAPALASLLLACGDASGPDVGEPESMVTVGGNGQAGRVGAPLPDALVAEVRDGEARGVPGVTVTFTVTSGGG